MLNSKKLKELWFRKRFFCQRGEKGGAKMFFDTEFLKNDEIQLVLERTAESDEAKNLVPAYHFFICDLNGNKMGKIDL